MARIAGYPLASGGTRVAFAPIGNASVTAAGASWGVGAAFTGGAARVSVIASGVTWVAQASYTGGSAAIGVLVPGSIWQPAAAFNGGGASFTGPALTISRVAASVIAAGGQRVAVAPLQTSTPSVAAAGALWGAQASFAGGAVSYPGPRIYYAGVIADTLAALTHSGTPSVRGIPAANTAAGVTWAPSAAFTGGGAGVGIVIPGAVWGAGASFVGGGASINLPPVTVGGAVWSAGAAFLPGAVAVLAPVDIPGALWACASRWIAGRGMAGGIEPAPDRMVHVPAEPRTVRIEAELRRVDITGEARGMNVNGG